MKEAPSLLLLLAMNIQLSHGLQIPVDAGACNRDLMRNFEMANNAENDARISNVY